MSKRQIPNSEQQTGKHALPQETPTWEKPFPVNGQGVLIFNKDTDVAFIISVEDEHGEYSLALKVELDRVTFFKYEKGQETILAQCTKSNCGVEKGKIAYWYSYDRDNLVLRYGKGYRMNETTFMVHDFLDGASKEEEKRIREEMYVFFNAEERRFIRKYEICHKRSAGADGISKTEQTVEFEKNPLICNISPKVLDSSKVNLFYLDEGDFIFSASLPPACRELYENIKGCHLNYPEEVTGVKLSDAIRFSIETKGCILFEKLREKEGEFGEDKNESYLRVTLGHSLGKSPGIPYVLEIWPKGHYSPIHNHGNANAVIKVLHGTIHIGIYNKHVHSSDAPTLREFDCYEGEVTWINRNWYQTHKLTNISNDYCATIQCYNYDAGDTTHWPYFDYISDTSTIEEFLPTSDFGFREMRENVLKEYTESLKKRF